MPSKKPSAASSPGKQPDPPTFFVDRSLGGRIVPAALRGVGANVIALDERYQQNTRDEEWLTACGRNGWVVITRDQRLRYRPAELAALRESGCLVFVVTAGDLTGPATAELLVKHLPRMIELARASSRPAIFRLNSSGVQPVGDQIG